MKRKGCFTLAAVLLVVSLLGIAVGPAWIEHGMKLLYPKPYGELVQREAGEFGLDENLIYAVIRTESGFDEDAASRAGARGLMQLTPATFEWISSLYPPENGGKSVTDPGDNIHCGCALLRLLLNQYGSLEVALCAYNAGMGNVSGWLGEKRYSHDGQSLHTIPYPETDQYVKKVKAAMERYEKLYAGRPEQEFKRQQEGKQWRLPVNSGRTCALWL